MTVRYDGITLSETLARSTRIAGKDRKQALVEQSFARKYLQTSTTVIIGEKISFGPKIDALRSNLNH